MANTLFALTNYMQTATITNGGGGSSPAREETSPYVMENALTADRMQFWQSAASPTSPFYFDVDLGSARTVTLAALLGFRAATVATVTTVEVFSSSTATYPRTWTSRGTFSMTASPRDNGTTFASVSARYWRFALTNTAAFTVGRLFLANASDTGRVGLPGGGLSPYRTRNEQPLIGGGVLIEDVGDPGAEFSFALGPGDATAKGYFDAISAAPGSFVYVTPEGNFYEVYAPGGRTEQARTFYASSGLYDLAVRLVRLP